MLRSDYIEQKQEQDAELKMVLDKEGLEGWVTHSFSIQAKTFMLLEKMRNDKKLSSYNELFLMLGNRMGYRWKQDQK